MRPSSQPAYIIVNADDYGYYNCVSNGILDLARNGIVTATGIFSNSVFFDDHIALLKNYEQLDLGVHLNLTEGEPLTQVMRTKLEQWNGRFPEKFTIAKAIITGVLKKDEIQEEWQAQIERCLDSKLQIRFLNSHEHIHMLPILFPIVQALAEKYKISHVRFPVSELFHDLNFGALIRDTIMKMLAAFNRRQLTKPVAFFLGMGESGKLSLEYMKNKLLTLKPGYVYELMCHPGYFDASEITEPRLLSYHDWEREFDTLSGPDIKEIFHKNGVQLIGYRDLNINNGHLTVMTEEAEFVHGK